jgi:hypothetical protein
LLLVEQEILIIYVLLAAIYEFILLAQGVT